MRVKPTVLLRRYQQLVTEMLTHIPKTRATELRQAAETLRVESETLLSDGRGRHWKRLRAEQLFEVAVRGQGVHHVRGFEAMASELGWKISTLRSRLSSGYGTTSFERPADGGGTELVTVTRLKSDRVEG